MVEPAFANIELLSFYDAWSSALGYTLQLYFDFSAYCEMAIGLALLFGIRLPINFNSPYKAVNIQDFWRRWHITLGAFLREYLYVPLGGSRFGAWRTAGALMLTMLLGGLWHGAGWQFIVWGLMHGFLLVGLQLWRFTGISLPRFVSQFITFMVVLLAWVMFRCDGVEQAWMMYGTMFGVNGWGFPQLYSGLELFDQVTYSSFFVGYELLLMLALTVGVFCLRNVHEMVRDLEPTTLNTLGFAVCLIVVIFNLSSPSSFLYFQF